MAETYIAVSRLLIRTRVVLQVLFIALDRFFVSALPKQLIALILQRHPIITLLQYLDQHKVMNHHSPPLPPPPLPPLPLTPLPPPLPPLPPGRRVYIPLQMCWNFGSLNCGWVWGEPFGWLRIGSNQPRPTVSYTCFPLV